jgi:hypothetical protein
MHFQAVLRPQQKMHLRPCMASHGDPKKWRARDAQSLFSRATPLRYLQFSPKQTPFNAPPTL